MEKSRIGNRPRLALWLGFGGALTGVVLLCFSFGKGVDLWRSTRRAPSSLSTTDNQQIATASSPSPGAFAAPLASPTPPQTGVNAADLYKDAFVLFNTLSAEEKKMISNPREEVDLEQAAALFEKIQPIVELLHRAKDASYCDWALGPVAFDKPMPQLTTVLKLGELARWDAAYRFPADPLGAIADIAATHQLGNSVSSAGLIGCIMGIGVKKMSWDLIAQNAPTLTPELTAEVRKLLNEPSRISDLAQAMSTEADLVRSLAETLANPQSRDETARRMVDVISQFEAEIPSRDKTDVPRLIEQLHWLEQIERDFPEKARLPESEFQGWWQQVSEAAKARPYTQLILPALDGFRKTVLRMEVSRAMLLAGLAVIQGGDAQLASIPDPATGRAFIYAPIADGGFQLRSTFQTSNNKPLTMSFPASTSESR